MRQPINSSSSVPAYQNLRKVDGFCDFTVKSSAQRLAGDLESGSKPLLKDKKRMVMLVNRFIFMKK